MTNDIELSANTILAVLAERHGARACLDAAAAAASALDHPTITGLHVRVDPMRDILPTEEMLLPTQERAMEIEAIEEGRALRDVFSTWIAGLDAHVETTWLDIADGVDDEVKALGTQAVLNVMANITPGSRGHARSAFHACLFKTHRPFLVVPSDYVSRKLSRILIGWKDTPPGRRVLDAALPWLRQADAVHLICIGRPDPLELTWAKEHLADHEIAADGAHVERREDVPVGVQLLDEARQFGADWLVTGAYWHTEYAEWIFGGVTEALLGRATLPLFMSH
ncbi:Universal stress protein family protein [Aminobacter sp. MSH1]|uniref:universal stress protein n=1 Tax=Aminobacter sp. MSH1 TaxID=374606 RepID=UPI000D3A4C77|nr:universal stress protein [Aminobacter sp. MSH1]AWC25228.1 Universal stress protein family protein [Aminobacter sp. MSH1]